VLPDDVLFFQGVGSFDERPVRLRVRKVGFIVSRAFIWVGYWVGKTMNMFYLYD